MISVQQADEIILAETRDYGVDIIPLTLAIGRTLAEDIFADRDFPPYDRITMDGIAISFSAFKSGTTSFTIKGTQAAGDTPIETKNPTDCVEVMTGASLPLFADTIIRYEDVEIKNNRATVKVKEVKEGQNIHRKGKDKQANELLVSKGQVITPAVVNTAASVGKTTIKVKRLPKVVVLSTGDELVDIDEQPTPYQVRRSNSYAMLSVLRGKGIQADTLHLPDNEKVMKQLLSTVLQQYDVLILSGGVSMGKYDYLPGVFEQLGIAQKFHKVKQRPGKPFWFGTHSNGKVLFAFPGNPVSSFMCMYRYFIPWLNATLGTQQPMAVYAKLDKDYAFNPELQYFLQVKLRSDKDGSLIATPSEGNGSGDFINLLNTQAFMELPEQETNFKKGEAYRIWPYGNIL